RRRSSVHCANGLIWRSRPPRREAASCSRTSTSRTPAISDSSPTTSSCTARSESLTSSGARSLVWSTWEGNTVARYRSSSTPNGTITPGGSDYGDDRGVQRWERHASESATVVGRFAVCRSMRGTTCSGEGFREHRRSGVEHPTVLVVGVVLRYLFGRI